MVISIANFTLSSKEKWAELVSKSRAFLKKKNIIKKSEKEVSKFIILKSLQHKKHEEIVFFTNGHFNL